MAKYEPRRHPKVEVRVRGGSRTTDTRDARDDATIIAWLQRIDSDMVKAAKQPVTPGGSPQQGGAAASNESLRSTLQDSFRKFTQELKRGFQDVTRALLDSLQQNTAGGLGDGEGPPRGKRKRRRGDEPEPGAARAPKLPSEGPPAKRPGTAVAPTPRGARFVGDSSVWMKAARRAEAGAEGESSGATGTMGSLGGAALASLFARVAGAIGAVASVAGAITAVAIGFTVATVAIKAFAQHVFDANKEFAVSGLMANVIAMANVRDVMRNMQTGDKTARSASVLGNSLGSLKDDLQPFVILIRNTLNLVAALFTKVASLVLNLPIFAGKSVKEIMQALNKLIENTLPEVEGESMGEWLDNVARDAKERKVGFGAGAWRPFEQPGDPYKGRKKLTVGPWHFGAVNP